LENNWIIAMPMIRGGGDLGNNWQREGLKTGKYKTVLDLVYCFKFLTGS